MGDNDVTTRNDTGDAWVPEKITINMLIDSYRERLGDSYALMAGLGEITDGQFRAASAALDAAIERDFPPELRRGMQEMAASYRAGLHEYGMAAAGNPTLEEQRADALAAQGAGDDEREGNPPLAEQREDAEAGAAALEGGR